MVILDDEAHLLYPVTPQSNFSLLLSTHGAYSKI
jgi:hypothetical protein